MVRRAPDARPAVPPRDGAEVMRDGVQALGGQLALVLVLLLLAIVIF